MKTLFKIIFLISFFATKAQVATFLDHQWSIEKIVTANEEITTDMDPPGIDDQLYINIISSSGYEYFLGECSGFIVFNDIEQLFTVSFVSCSLSGEGITDNFFTWEFIVAEGGVEESENGPIYGPFSYDFREEGDLIYLDITNVEGSVATFWASTLSSSNFEVSDFSIYPNPVGNQLHIQSKNAVIQHIEIFNLSGKQVLKLAYKPNESVDVSSLAQGLYVLKIETETGIFTKKLVKE